jgi:hypothetical protein
VFRVLISEFQTRASAVEIDEAAHGFIVGTADTGPLRRTSMKLDEGARGSEEARVRDYCELCDDPALCDARHFCFELGIDCRTPLPEGPAVIQEQMIWRGWPDRKKSFTR